MLADLQDVDTTGEATGSIMLYDATSGKWEAQANSIDNLTDGYNKQTNVVLGKPDANYTNTGTDYFNIYIGHQAGGDSILGYANTAIGALALSEFNANPYVGDDSIDRGNGNTAIGPEALKQLRAGFSNVAIGRESMEQQLKGSNNIAVGRQAGFAVGIGGIQADSSVFLGSDSAPRDTFSTNEIVIGAFATGNGSNTATLGNNNITATYLKGTTNLRGYGLGNKEASDLSKTGSGYFLEVATDGTLIESTVTGGSAQTLSFDESTRALSISGGNSVDLSEGIQEEIAGTLVAGTGITITYNDLANTITIAAPAGSGNTDEQTLSLDNATAVLSISNGNSVDLSEAIDNQVNTLTVAGTNISKVYNDGANTLTLSTTDALTAIDAITFDANTTTEVANRLQFNTDYNTLTFGMANATPIRIGQDLGWLVKNQTGTTIAKGVAVMAVGTVGASGRILIDELVADGSVDAHYFLGVTAETIADGADGFVTSQGHIRGINTSAFTAGAVLYASPSTPGAFTATEPTGNDLKLPLAFVLNSDAVNGEIAVRADAGASIKDLHDVDVTGIANNSILKYNSASQVWAIGTDNSESTTASNGLTLSGVDVKLGGTLTGATTITMAGNDMTFTGTSGSDMLIDLAGSTTINSTNASGYNSSLILDGTSPRLLADAKTTEPLNMIELMGGRAGIKEMTLSSQVSNDNTTYTAMYFNPTRVSLKTPNVTDLTAQNGQFLQLVDRLTGEIEFASALSAEVDGSVTNEGSLSVTTGTGTTSVINSNTSGSAAVTLEASTGLSIGEAGNTITLTNTAPDQTVSLTGGGITAISGTYPNFTITSTEVDGSTTNELQNLSIASNILSLSNSAATIDLSGYLDNTDAQSISLTGNTLSISGNASTVDLSGYVNNITSVSKGLTLSSGALTLGGQFSNSVTLQSQSNAEFALTKGSATSIYLDANGKLLLSSGASNQNVEIGALLGGNIDLIGYGTGSKEASDFSPAKTVNYLAGIATDGTVIDVAASSLQATASNGLTKTGSNIELGGTLTKATQINLPANGSLIIGDLANAPVTSLAVLDANNTVVTYGTAVLADYGSNNKEASDLSVTVSNYKAAFATDGTLIEVSNIDAMVIACSDETTDITTGTAKVTFRAPFAMTITGVRASLATASSSGTPTVDINEAGVSILGTKLSIDANEKTSTTAASAATITDTAIADDAEITIDIDAAGTGAKGLKVTILYRK
jgi:hypothetical protein